MKGLSKVLMGAALAVAMAGTASAQWVINEFQSDSVGSPDAQFIELYNPTANASVNGLTVIGVRISQRRAVTAIDLTGTATGNYYVIGNATFNTENPGLADAVLTDPLRASFGQILLVNTADLPGGFTANPTTGYQFSTPPNTATEFAGGTQVIDNLFYGFGDALDDADILWLGTELRFAGGTFSPIGGQRFPDGAATTQINELGGSAPNLLTGSTPGAANVDYTASSVSDWELF